MPVSQAMKDHLAGPVTYLTTLWKLTARGGEIVRATNHTRHITYNNELYLALPLTPTNIKSSVGLAPNNGELQALMSNDAVSELELLAQKWSYATLEITVVNYLDLTMGHATYEKGFFGEIVVVNGAFKAEFRGVSDKLNQPIGHLYQPECSHDLGDGNCRVNLTLFTHTTTVTAVASRRSFTIALTQADRYFEKGKLTFTSGNNAGLSERIVNNIGGVLTLELPMFADIAIGNALTVVAGCNKTRERCKSFGSYTTTGEPAIYDFGAFPDLPGRDRLFKTRPDGK